MNNIEPVAAATYTINSGAEMAFELTYLLDCGDEYKVRSILMADKMIRVEGLFAGKWKANKPYIIKTNKKRQGDRVVEKVKAILAA
jgi:hypothetical protein